MRVGLFIPCYINAAYPEVGIATFKLLEHLGVDIDYPLPQTCCGQPMANAGFETSALPLARRLDALFAPYERVVTPSASCAAFIRIHHPAILAGGDTGSRAKNQTEDEHPCHTHEKIVDLCEFLHDVLRVTALPGVFPHRVSIHNSCHGVRELRLSSASELNIPRYSKIAALLALVRGIDITEPERPDECCGFGGMFAVEVPAVSACMGREKVRRHLATGAEYITGADSSCLMHMQGIARREKLPARFIHVAQILASGL
ncbi:MAG: (Fe-S)-binding protein [Odoribacteraceae bacterium]|jgi:L-lactate dehydrogenase complex protein LldE|nr:(Fe-S)-binding protein [Odoribacteraceae bacterium]